jgi:hypothetical protein
MGYNETSEVLQIIMYKEYLLEFGAHSDDYKYQLSV